ncbi:MAG: VOC family protein [Candidatus Dormibacteraeota bacterium]|uniref:VOC family protein n=1 Tax=Candidatus Dormiibacter inghamiae TaxID=3127013 RepID=A0A934N7R7_9BACT|nr:VOC family protein [Candidatus Dormibacteraeota bacterium]MBJ7607156.1 VOC family protein [Candidatus Dormibacteraeota bacterium]
MANDALVTGSAHVGIAVADVASMFAVLHAFGFDLRTREQLPAQSAWSNIVAAGDQRLELLEAQGSSGAISRYLERRGPGLHHLCLTVRDLRAAIDVADRNNLRLVNRRPSQDSDGFRVFLHPASMQGVLVGLVQPN